MFKITLYNGTIIFTNNLSCFSEKESNILCCIVENKSHIYFNRLDVEDISLECSFNTKELDKKPLIVDKKENNKIEDVEKC